MHPRFIIISFLVFILFFSCKSWSSKENGTSKIPQIYIEKLDSSLMENSGIIYWNKLIWTFNDSGGKNELYGFDAKNGEIITTIRLTNARNIDWEDIAQDDDYIYIAEFGNNVGDRIDLQVLKIAKRDINRDNFQDVDAEKIYFQYSNQTQFVFPYKGHGFDAEALMAWEGDLYLFSKDWKDYKTTVYKIPTTTGEYILSPKDSFEINGLVTGADIDSKGLLALVGYMDYKSFAWVFDVDDKSLFNNPRYIDLSMLENAQTEGICFTPKGDLLISCEQTVNYPQMIWKIRRSSFTNRKK